MGSAERANRNSLVNMPINQRDVLDRFGRPLHKGDMVVLPGIPDCVWRVTDISSSADPRVEKHNKQIILVATTLVIAQTGHEFNPGLILVVPKEAVPGPDQSSPEGTGLVLP